MINNSHIRIHFFSKYWIRIFTTKKFIYSKKNQDTLQQNQTNTNRYGLPWDFPCFIGKFSDQIFHFFPLLLLQAHRQDARTQPLQNVQTQHSPHPVIPFPCLTGSGFVFGFGGWAHGCSFTVDSSTLCNPREKEGLKVKFNLCTLQKMTSHCLFL